MNVPKLRFKADDGSEFPEWEEKKIGDLIEIYDEKVNSDCELPILTSSKKYGIQYQNDHFGREQLHDISGYNVLPYGYCTYRNRSDGTDFTFNINTLCKRGIVSKFYPVFTSKTTDLYVLASLLNNEKSTVKKIAYTAKGTGQKVLSISDLQNINVRIPCVAEQKKIAAFLSTIDDIITTTQSELTAWQERKKGVMQKIFNREVRFKADDGSEFPEWEEKRLGDVFVERSERSADNLDLLSVTIANGVIRQNESDKRNVSSVDKSNYKRVYIGDLAYNSMRMWQGAEGVSAYDGIVSPAYTVLVPKKQEYVYFYEYMFKRTEMLHIFQRYSQGLTSDTWNLKYPALSHISVVVPSLLEQKKIAECLSSVDGVIRNIQAELSAWKEFKKGLLQQMFV